MGASQARLIRQMLVESLTLCCSGGVLGLLGALSATHLLNGLLPAATLPVPIVGMDGRIACFAIALLTGLLVGMAPAWQGSHTDVNELIRSGGRGIAGTPGNRLRKALASLELALATLDRKS